MVLIFMSLSVPSWGQTFLGARTILYPLPAIPPFTLAFPYRITGFIPTNLNPAYLGRPYFFGLPYPETPVIPSSYLQESVLEAGEPSLEDPTAGLPEVQYENKLPYLPY